MSPRVEPRVVSDKIAVVERMVADLRSLPASDLESFLQNRHIPAAAESYLRRALEALMDLGRHLLAKGFGSPVNEYSAIADQMLIQGVLGRDDAATLRKMAKYRNRMVHFYDEVTVEELHDIVTQRLDDFHHVLEAINAWLAEHPERVRPD